MTLSHAYRWLALALLLVMPLAGCTTAQARGIASTPTLGLVPRTCPHLSAPQVIGRVFGTGVGGTVGAVRGYGAAPLWTFLGPPPATLLWSPNPQDPNSRFDPPYGFGHKMLWVLQPGFKGRVTMTGGSIYGGKPLWFSITEVGAPDTLARVATFQASRQMAFSGGTGAWPAFPGALIVPQAGCYFLAAHWPGGHWRITFAAGRARA